MSFISRWSNEHSQEFRKCNRIVMCSIVRAVEQCYRPFALGLDNRPPPIGISFEFREILESEFIPLCWIVFEPIVAIPRWERHLS
jgi:hypothetical protein